MGTEDGKSDGFTDGRAEGESDGRCVGLRDTLGLPVGRKDGLVVTTGWGATDGAGWDVGPGTGVGWIEGGGAGPGVGTSEEGTGGAEGACASTSGRIIPKISSAMTNIFSAIAVQVGRLVNLLRHLLWFSFPARGFSGNDDFVGW